MSNYRLKGASGPVINQVFKLGARSLIGRADDCDLRIDVDGVASHHAEIRENADGGLVLVSPDPEALTQVNGEAVVHAVLASGDEIRIGNCRWVLQAPGLRPEKVLSSGPARPRHNYMPWLITLGLLAAASLAWYRGLLPF
ncbi:FHA domain-containing protein [Pseudomonadota bacterium]